MEGGLWATALGTVAGICSTVSFVPQVIKAWRENDTEAISKRMYFVTVTAFVLWTIYGFAIGSLPIIIFNLLSFVLSGTILVLKLRNQQRGEGAGAQPQDRPGSAREPTQPHAG
jgi:MtN3 and saliva related transmembrane protein